MASSGSGTMMREFATMKVKGTLGPSLRLKFPQTNAQSFQLVLKEQYFSGICLRQW